MEKYGNRHPAFSRVDDGHWSACGAFGHSVHNTRIRLSSPLCKPFIFRMGLPSANPYNISIWNSWNSSVLFPFFPTSARLPARQSIIMLYTWLIYIKWNGTLLNRKWGVGGAKNVCQKLTSVIDHLTDTISPYPWMPLPPFCFALQTPANLPYTTHPVNQSL